ncbi:MAG TPA: hydroxyethylthiazole kinase [Candidatus Micrarchaeota archaeon]|nr:hydroxyethylthiazole kinase [Candidatus Micrarchaeota archaeon]
MPSPYVTLAKVREKKPLVHHITNWVTIYDCANVVRAFGALPVMAHAKEEAADMAGISSALVLNIGTLTTDLIDSMLLAGKKANSASIPVVLDAVGAGATKFRSDETRRLLDKLEINVLKGNAGEMASIAGIKAEVRGVESISAGAKPEDICRQIAKDFGCTAVITGKTDVCASKSGVYFVENGHQMMGTVVGTGCMATSVIGAFCAVEKDYALASAHALSCYGIAGELAALKSNGPGSFKTNFYDEIYALDKGTIEKMAKVKFESKL